MKYTLFVSYNCGVNYHAEAESDNPEELIQQTQKLDEDMLRWSIEDEEGNFVDISKIHKNIICSMEKIRQTEEVT